MGALLPPPHAPGAKRRRPAELEHDEQAASGVAQAPSASFGWPPETDLRHRSDAETD